MSPSARNRGGSTKEVLKVYCFCHINFSRHNELVVTNCTSKAMQNYLATEHSLFCAYRCSQAMD